MILCACLSGCASLKEPQNPDIFSYSYLSLNFSGAGWDRARSQCARQQRQARHLGTECGFFVCTTTVACVTEPDDVSRSVRPSQ